MYVFSYKNTLTTVTVGVASLMNLKYLYNSFNSKELVTVISKPNYLSYWVMINKFKPIILALAGVYNICDQNYTFTTSRVIINPFTSPECERRSDWYSFRAFYPEESVPVRSSDQITMARKPYSRY